MERREPTHTFYPDDTMMSDESDGTSFPAVHSGPTGRIPDNPPGPAEHVTMRRPRRIHPDTPDPRQDRPLSWQEWLAVQADFNRDHGQAARDLGQAAPAYFEDMYVPENRYIHAKGPATLTILCPEDRHITMHHPSAPPFGTMMHHPSAPPFGISYQ